MLSPNQSTSTPSVSSTFMLKKYPLLEPGSYAAVINGWKVVPVLFGGAKLLIQCAVTVEDEVIELAMFCNVKLSADNQILPPGRRSHLHKLMSVLLPSDTCDRDLNDLIGLKCIAMVETS